MIVLSMSHYCTHRGRIWRRMNSRPWVIGWQRKTGRFQIQKSTETTWHSQPSLRFQVCPQARAQQSWQQIHGRWTPMVQPQRINGRRQLGWLLDSQFVSLEHIPLSPPSPPLAFLFHQSLGSAFLENLNHIANMCAYGWRLKS